MSKRDEIISIINKTLDKKLITEDDLIEIISNRNNLKVNEVVTTENKPLTQTTKEPVVVEGGKANASDIMFYVAGIIFYIAIMVSVVQFSSIMPLLKTIATLGFGSVLLAGGIYYKKFGSSTTSAGLGNALIMSAILLLISGSFIASLELAENYTILVTSYLLAAFFAIIGVVEIKLGKYVNSKLLYLFGTLLLSASVPIILSRLTFHSTVPLHNQIWQYFIWGGSGALLIYMTHLFARFNIIPEGEKSAFNSLGTFVIFFSLYLASYSGTLDFLWLAVTMLGVIGLFYLSIIKQSKLMLGNASFFLILTIVSAAFRLFPGGVGVSLLIAAVGMLVTAIIASVINNKYIKYSSN